MDEVGALKATMSIANESTKCSGGGRSEGEREVKIVKQSTAGQGMMGRDNQ
jgi:hypothetical protein